MTRVGGAGRARPRSRRAWVFAGFWTLMIWFLAAPGVAAPQDSSTEPSARPRPERPLDDAGPRGREGPLRAITGGLPVRPSPADFGPLRPGEERAFLQFAQQKLPHMYPPMKRVADARPAAFRERMQQIAPHIRLMQRLYAVSATLGNALAAHSRNLVEIRRAEEFLRRANRTSSLGPEPGGARHAQLIQGLRARLAENVQNEIAILSELIRLRSVGGEAEITSVVESLAQPETDNSDFPPEARRWIEEFRAAQQSGERETARRELRARVSERFARETAAWRERLAELRERGPFEVDRRLRRILDDTRDVRGPRAKGNPGGADGVDPADDDDVPRIPNGPARPDGNRPGEKPPPPGRRP